MHPRSETSLLADASNAVAVDVAFHDADRRWHARFVETGPLAARVLKTANRPTQEKSIASAKLRRFVARLIVAAKESTE